MKVIYFSDTDTAHVEFTDKEVRETKEIRRIFILTWMIKAIL